MTEAKVNFCNRCHVSACLGSNLNMGDLLGTAPLTQFNHMNPNFKDTLRCRVGATNNSIFFQSIHRCSNANFTKSQHFPGLTTCISRRGADSSSLSGTDLGSVVLMWCPQTLPATNNNVTGVLCILLMT